MKIVRSFALLVTSVGISTCASSGQQRLVSYLKKSGAIKSDRVEYAMLAVDRAEFVSEDSKQEAYNDHPLNIGYAATISAPHMHAYALEEMQDVVQPGSKVLEIGSGSGYLAVCLSKLMKDQGQVIGIEHIPQLVATSISNISKSHGDLLNSGKIRILIYDGRAGLPEEGPYSAIIISAAAEKIPYHMIDQLANGGKLLTPVGHVGDQEIYIISKDSEGKVSMKATLAVSFVPLTSREKQWSSEF